MRHALHQLRLIHLVFILCVPFFAWIAERAPEQSSGATPVYWILVAAGLGSAAAGIRVGGRLLSSLDPKDATGDLPEIRIHRWKTGHFVRVASAESVALYGVITRMTLGLTLWFAVPFYVVSLCLLLLWTPRLPKP